MKVYKKENYIENGICLGLFKVTENTSLEKHIRENLDKRLSLPELAKKCFHKLK